MSGEKESHVVTRKRALVVLPMVAILILLTSVNVATASSRKTAVADSPATVKTVTTLNLKFHPAKLTIKVGTTVVWKNTDTVTHNVKSYAKPRVFDGDIAPGESYTFTFTTAGRFPYFCEYHVKSGMKGLIVVKP